MNLIEIITLGIVEGITEFLPISSTFHLIWTSILLGVDQTDFIKLFLVVIQAGAILAVVLLYWKDFFTNRAMVRNIIATFIPTAIIGFILYGFIKGIFFESTDFTTTIFILIGILFLVVEYLVSQNKIKPEKQLSKLTTQDALLIGFIQAISVIPGVSRSGSVIIGMLFMKFKREEAAKYSFLVSVPTIFAASVFDLYEMQDALVANTNAVPTLIFGSLIAFISAYIGVKWFIGYLQKNSLALFGWYRIVVGIILLIILGMHS
ncbi:MAG TPA: undecaprenyl-diphosphate phosphatase [Candidatus Woesebacteria bacterium]|nr:undecaprenyl-diphosphate phosphatase [Candidatus Woesebacteria bacterium]